MSIREPEASSNTAWRLFNRSHAARDAGLGRAYCDWRLLVVVVQLKRFSGCFMLKEVNCRLSLVCSLVVLSYFLCGFCGWDAFHLITQRVQLFDIYYSEETNGLCVQLLFKHTAKCSYGALLKSIFHICSRRRFPIVQKFDKLLHSVPLSVPAVSQPRPASLTCPRPSSFPAVWGWASCGQMLCDQQGEDLVGVKSVPAFPSNK